MNILILGKMGSGKTEVSKILCRQYGYTNYSMATWLKSTINSHYELINPKKGDKIQANKELTVREAYQKFGELIRSFDNTWHIVETFKSIKQLPFVIDDIRYLNEIQFLESRFDTMTFRVTCDENIRIQRICKRDALVPDINISSHKSETELESFQTDITINNSGSMNDLIKQLDFLKSL